MKFTRHEYEILRDLLETELIYLLVERDENQDAATEYETVFHLHDSIAGYLLSLKVSQS